MSDAAPGRAIRIMSWNIHGAVGADRRCDPERVLAVVRRHRPDILALQEIDGRVHLRRLARAFETFGEALGDHVTEARLFGTPDRAYGHLLWSRWPVEAATVHRLPGRGAEPRGAIEARVASPFGAVRVIAAHFGLSLFARREQAAFVAELAGREGPAVAIGDFNEWRKAGGVHRRLAGPLPVHILPKSWPARRPFVALDRFYAGADVRVVDWRVDAAAAAASDHLPLIVEITLG